MEEQVKFKLFVVVQIPCQMSNDIFNIPVFHSDDLISSFPKFCRGKKKFTVLLTTV